MKAKLKAFFQSNVFRCVTVLLAIVLVSGALLSVCNDLLFVSAEERFARTLAKIYGRQVETTQLSVSAEDAVFAEGTVNAAYLTDDGNYLIQSTGNGGYSGGTVTLWTVFSCEGSKEAHEEILAGGKFTTAAGGDDIYTLSAGASRSSAAIVNGVNTALAYFRAHVLGGEA